MKTLKTILIGCGLLGMSQSGLTQPIDEVDIHFNLGSASSVYRGQVAQSASEAMVADQEGILRISSTGSMSYAKDIFWDGNKLNCKTLIAHSIGGGAMISDAVNKVCTVNGTGDVVWGKVYPDFLATGMCESHDQSHTIVFGIRKEDGNALFRIMKYGQMSGALVSTVELDLPCLLPMIDGNCVNITQAIKTTEGYFIIVKSSKENDVFISLDNNLNPIKVSEMQETVHKLEYTAVVQGLDEDLYLIADPEGTGAIEGFIVQRMTLNHSIVNIQEIFNSSDQLSVEDTRSNIVEIPNPTTFFQGGTWGSITNYQDGAAYAIPVGIYRHSRNIPAVIEVDPNLTVIASVSYDNGGNHPGNKLLKDNNDELRLFYDSMGGDEIHDYRLSGTLMGCFAEHLEVETRGREMEIQERSIYFNASELTILNPDWVSLNRNTETNFLCSSQPRSQIDYNEDSFELEKSTANFDFKVYPNPATDVVNIQIEDASSANINVFNTIGQQVEFTQNITNNLVEIRGLKRGMYILQLESGGEIFTERVVIK